MRPKGLVTVSGVVDADGKPISTQQAVDYGWIVPARGNFQGWGLTKEEVPLGKNLFVDQGRQLLAYAFGFRAPIENYVCRKFGVGTGRTPAKVTDIALESPVTLDSGFTTGAVDSIDFLSAFLVRVSFTLGTADANGYAISELGLFTGSDVLLARKLRSVVINKTSDFSPTLTWRLRF